MQYILPTALFEGMVNEKQWSSLTDIGINEIYILSVIISHIKLNGQVDPLGNFSLREPFGLEYEISHGRLDYVLDDIRERFLRHRTRVIPFELCKRVCVFSALLFKSLGHHLVGMIESLKLTQNHQLHGLDIVILGMAHQGIMIDIKYNRNLETRGFNH